MSELTNRCYCKNHIVAAWLADQFGISYDLADNRERVYCSGGFIGVMMFDGMRLLGSRPLRPDERLYIGFDSVVVLNKLPEEKINALKELGVWTRQQSE